MWLLLLLACSSLLAMEKSDSVDKTLQLLEKLKPFSNTAIKKIPRYVFENCNQAVSFEWPDEKFKKLQAASRTASKEKLLKAHGENKEVFTKNAEAYDWIYGLEYLQSIDTSRIPFVDWLTVDRLIDINSKLSRLVNPDPGIRKRNIFWYIKPLAKVTPTTDLFFRTVSDNRERFFEKKDVHIIEGIFLRRWFAALVLGHAPLLNSVTGLIEKVDPTKYSLDEIEEWIKKYPGPDPDTLNFDLWFRDHIHEFPTPAKIPAQLEDAIEAARRGKHPVIQAAFLWWDSIRIHLSHEANKRTGKACAVKILLDHGYLPPKITAANGAEQRYLNLLTQGIPKGSVGFYEFLRFVIEMIAETQKEYENERDSILK